MVPSDTATDQPITDDMRRRDRALRAASPSAWSTIGQNGRASIISWCVIREQAAGFAALPGGRTTV